MKINENYDPVLKNRYVVEFPAELNIKSYTVQSICKPMITGKRICLMCIKFMEITNSSPVGGIFHLTSLKKRDLKKVKFTISTLDSQGQVQGKWIITIKKILGVDFGSNSYEDSSPQIITMKIKPLKCEYIPSN